MQCQKHWLVPAIVILWVLVCARPGLAQGAAGPEHVAPAPELVQTDERTQRAVLRADDGSQYVVQAGEVDAVTGLVLQHVGASTVIFEGSASGLGAGLRLRIETDGRQSHATWSSDVPPAELMQITPVWRLLAPMDTTAALPEDDR